MKRFLLLLLCVPAFANTYFVSNSGNDANPGTSPSRPWQTLAHVNGTWFLPGDVILLERGNIWREQLLPPSSGSPGRQITFAEYGTGANPVVSGGDLVSGFVAAGPAGVWCAAVPKQPNVVFISGVLAAQQVSSSLLSQAGQWNWSAGSLCVFSASAAPTDVEAAQRDYALLLGQTGQGSYVTVTGIDFRLANIDTVHIVNTSGDVINGGVITGAYQFGIFAIGVNGTTVNHLMISDNTVAYHGSSGIEISSGHNNVTLHRNTVFGNAYNPQNAGNFQFMAGIYLYSDVQVPNNDLIQYNVSHDNGVAGGVESQGVGIWLDTLSNSTLRYNVAFNNLSHGIYFEKNMNSVMTNNLSYSNASAANTADIACYADFGTPAVGNMVVQNISWNSHGWGMKLGAYQGGGATQFEGNTVENNIILNSATLAVFVDSGANNDMVNGWNNRLTSNAFGPESPNWIYWTGVGEISTYVQLQAAYGASMGSNKINTSQMLTTLNSLTISPSTEELILSSATASNAP